MSLVNTEVDILDYRSVQSYVTERREKALGDAAPKAVPKRSQISSIDWSKQCSEESFSLGFFFWKRTFQWILYTFSALSWSLTATAPSRRRIRMDDLLARSAFAATTGPHFQPLLPPERNIDGK